MWLDEAGCPFDDRGAVQVSTVEGAVIARPGDWIVLSFSHMNSERLPLASWGGGTRSAAP